MFFLPPRPRALTIDAPPLFTSTSWSIDEAALSVILREPRITAKQIANGLRSSKRRLRDMERMVSRGREPVDYASVKGNIAVDRSGMYGSQVRDLKGMMTLAGMRSISYPDGHPAETAYGLAAWIVADEFGLLTAHESISCQGHTTRKNAEFCLLGRRGKPKWLSAKVEEVIISPLREHSRKPEEAWQRIEEYAAGPYIELNARTERRGWHAWGNETDRFAA